MRLKYYNSLDGIRGLAALMVMFCHFFTYVQAGDSTILNLLVKAAAIGQSGVILFFVLSGFLITRILINSKNERGYFTNFYARRSLRIFPLSVYIEAAVSFFYFEKFFLELKKYFKSPVPVQEPEIAQPVSYSKVAG